MLDFFDVYLKNGKTEKIRLKQSKAWRGLPDSAVGFRYSDALPASPSYADLLQIILEKGILRGEQIYREILKQDPGAKVIGEQSINELSYELSSAGRIDEAIRIAQLNVERFPRSANAYDYLADAFKKKGNQPCVVQAYRKLLEVLPRDTTLNESEKTSLQRSATENLNKLKDVSNSCQINDR